MATTFSASLRPTRTRILLIALTVVVLLGYGLFTAQRARSATLTKKAFAGVEVVSGTATLVHPSHVTAVVYEAMGQYERAEKLYQRALDICKQILGHTHPDTVACFNDLARLYRKNGQF